LTLLVSLKCLASSAVVILVVECEVDQNSSLWLTVLALDEVNILSVDVSQEGLAEIEVLGVVVHIEGHALAEVLLLAS
jgi:hypothetical protein